MEQDDNDLSKPIMENEIKAAIWSLQADKTPGLDGFTINFYRESWDTVKEDLKIMLNWRRRNDKVGGHQLFFSHFDTKRKKTQFNRSL